MKTEKTNIARVHRFRDTVAVRVGGGTTMYLTAKQAKILAAALNNCAKSVRMELFVDSRFLTVKIFED